MQGTYKNQNNINGNYNNEVYFGEAASINQNYISGTQNISQNRAKNISTTTNMSSRMQQNMNNVNAIDNSMQKITRIDHSFALSNQEKFESNCLEIYEIKL